jgi:cell division protein FtsI (penicillin-binding protein 3)
VTSSRRTTTDRRSSPSRGRGRSPRRAPRATKRVESRAPRPDRSGTRAPARSGPGRDRDRSGGGSARRRWGWRVAGDPHRRAIALLGVLLLLFTGLVVRLVMVQVVGADRYVAYGESQRVQGIDLAAGRGSIFDRNGYDLAVTIPQRSVVADPRLVTRPAEVARVLAPLLGLDEGQVREELSRESAFVYIARRVPDEVADRVEAAVEAEDLEGVWFVEEPQRFNPAGELGRSVIGQVGVDNAGLSGLELQYDEALTGTPGELVLERDPEGRTIPAGRHHFEPAEPGDDLFLTIDRGLQFEAERVLREHVLATGALAGTAIVSDPETGEIRALVNLTADGQSGQVVDSGNNLAVTANYEPGSVSKVITLAAALEEGVVTPDTTFQVPGSLRVGDHTFSDSHDHPTETYTVAEILSESSNVGTIMVAQQLGEQRLYDYLRGFGFGQPTELGFPNEVWGAFPEPEDWSGTSIGTIPIGHGISVTAMQMLSAYNTIANDGVYVPPRLVGEILDADGERHRVPMEETHRVLSPQTAGQMRQMMADVVAGGTGELAAIDGYEVAGKTGTARKPAPGGGYLWPDGRYHYVATFAGFMPASDPRLSVIVVLDEPRGDFASATAAPTFADLSRYALRLLRIPPPASQVAATGGDDTAAVRGVAAPAAAPTAPPSTAPPSTLVRPWRARPATRG